MKNLMEAFQNADTTTKQIVPKAKSIPKEQDLEKALLAAFDEHIDTTINSRYVKWGGFHPSTTNECARYAVYLFRGVELPPNHNARVQRIFDNGHAMHERYGKYLKDMGIAIEIELPVWCADPPIEGTCDGIIEWDGPTLVEFKSISEAGFTYRRLYHKPKDEHYRQAQLYMHALGLKKGFVIYENKNNQEILVFLIHYDEAFIEKVKKKYNKIHQAFKDGVLPARPYKQDGDKCRNCQLNALCWSDPDDGKKI